MKTVLKQASQQCLILRQRDHAIADIAGGRDAVFTPQAPRASAVIGYGDDGGEVGRSDDDPFPDPPRKVVFRPRSNIERPVPPPIATTRAPERVVA